MTKEELKKELVELFKDYCVWNEERHKDTPDPSRYLSFAGFTYWLEIDDKNK